MLRKIRMSVLVLVALSSSMLFTGCSGNVCRMIPTEFEIVNKYNHTVCVNNSIGGRESNPLWTPQISDSAFTGALRESLAKSGVFQGVIIGGNAEYMLDVTILDYDQPVIGLDFDVSMKTKWELTDAKTLIPVWSDTFETTYRAKVADAFFAVERLQMANAGSVRVNIKEGIKRLSMLDL